MQTVTVDQKKVAVLIVNDEIVRNSMKGVLESVGFEIRQDIEACRRAAVGFVGSYFAVLGILRQAREVNPSLPLVLIMSGGDELDSEVEPYQHFYDVITFNDKNEKGVKQGILRWFSKGRGKSLLNEKG